MTDQKILPATAAPVYVKVCGDCKIDYLSAHCPQCGKADPITVRLTRALQPKERKDDTP